jgi:hypothetical protein
MVLFLDSAGSAFPAERLRIGYSGITVSNAMLWVTHEAKFFQKNGLDVEPLYLQTTLGQNALSQARFNWQYFPAASWRRPGFRAPTRSWSSVF